MGVVGNYECGCKEVYRFTYPYPSCIYLLFFAAASLSFVHFLIYIIHSEQQFFL